MKTRAPAPSWLRWLLLAACAGCLNPHPDDEPTAVPVAAAPGSKDDNDGASTGSNGSPPVLIGDDQGTGQEPQPSQETPPGGVADAGSPPSDAGATGGDAGPAETP